MNVTNVKNQLVKQRLFKSTCLKKAQEFEQPVVELRKDIDALDCAIRVLGKIERSRKQ